VRRIDKQQPAFKRVDIDLYFNAQMIGRAARELANSLSGKIIILENARYIAVSGQNIGAESMVVPARIVTPHLSEDRMGVSVEGITKEIILCHLQNAP
jgi:hypothetical protein